MNRSGTKRGRVLIVDDQRLNVQLLTDILQDHYEISVAVDGERAVELCARRPPDLVLLDVQMPGRTGLEVVEAVGPEQMPATIFTTAFDRFALKAFEVAAVDYLVKPFDDERFTQALRRARRSIELQDVGRMTEQLLTLLNERQTPAAATAPPAPEQPHYLERISVETRGQVRVVPVSRIDYITASGPYAELHVGERTFAIRERMQTLADQLDPAVFFRIHRSAIVRLDRIDALLHAAGGDYAVRLKDGTELSVSRAKRDELESRMGVS